MSMVRFWADIPIPTIAEDTLDLEIDEKFVVNRDK